MPYGASHRPLVPPPLDPLGDPVPPSPRPTAELVHLMSDDLLDACGTAPHGEGLHLAPETTPERITCAACRKLLGAVSS
jgi:hypothetical protein